MQGNGRTRREVVQLGGGAAGLAVTGGLAGCSALPFFGGPPGYADWLYAPGTVDDRNHLQYRKGKLDQLRGNAEELGGAINSYRATEQQWPMVTMNLQFDQVDEAFRIGPRSGRITGDFEANTVGNALTNKGFEEEGDYGDYTLYVEPSRAAGLVDGEAIYCDETEFTDDFEPRQYVEAVIDTKNGDGERYIDESEPFKQLTTRVGDATLVGGLTYDKVDDGDPGQGLLADSVGAGFAINVNGENSTVKRVVVYESEDDVDMDAVSEFADSDQFSAVDDPSTNQREVTAVIKGTAPTSDLDFPSIF